MERIIRMLRTIGLLSRYPGYKDDYINKQLKVAHKNSSLPASFYPIGEPQFPPHHTGGLIRLLAADHIVQCECKRTKLKMQEGCTPSPPIASSIRIKGVKVP